MPGPEAALADPFTAPHQLRGIERWIPNSVATWVTGRLLEASSDTASRLNASVNERRVGDSIATSPLLRSLHEVSTVPGEGQNQNSGGKGIPYPTCSSD